MTKFGTVMKLFSNGLIAVLFAFGLVACAKSDQILSNGPDHGNFPQQNILGGEKVLPTSKFSSSVLFLSLGVKIEKSAKGISVSQKTQCTAFAISPKIILTAAHCVTGLRADEIYVVLGNNPMKVALDLTLWYEAEKVVSHSGYDPDAKLYDIKAPINDIAVIKLKNSLDQKHVSEIAEEKNLPKNLTMKPDLLLAGYGLRSNEDAKMNDGQHIGELHAITKKAELFSANDPTILIDQYDAKGICSGDSGSAAYIYDSVAKEHYVVGILNGYTWDVDPAAKAAGKPHPKCVGTARYTSIITPEISHWLTQTIGGL
jgi:V8-like Glu-specific endopeptidase